MLTQDALMACKPGHGIRIAHDQSYLVPLVLESDRVLSLGPVLLPNISDAMEIPPGVSPAKF